MEELSLLVTERERYINFEKAMQKGYTAVRDHLLLHGRGSSTMEVSTLLSRFQEVVHVFRNVFAGTFCSVWMRGGPGLSFHFGTTVCIHLDIGVVFLVCCAHHGCAQSKTGEEHLHQIKRAAK